MYLCILWKQYSSLCAIYLKIHFFNPVVFHFKIGSLQPTSLISWVTSRLLIAAWKTGISVVIDFPTSWLFVLRVLGQLVSHHWAWVWSAVLQRSYCACTGRMLASLSLGKCCCCVSVVKWSLEFSICPSIKPDAHSLPSPLFKVTSVGHPLQKQFSENL